MAKCRPSLREARPHLTNSPGNVSAMAGGVTTGLPSRLDRATIPALDRGANTSIDATDPGRVPVTYAAAGEDCHLVVPAFVPQGGVVQCRK